MDTGIRGECEAISDNIDALYDTEGTIKTARKLMGLVGTDRSLLVRKHPVVNLKSNIKSFSIGLIPHTSLKSLKIVVQCLQN